jgi:murein DD-endopeptidase MepM/ murein hydrolase activator NlpD
MPWDVAPTCDLITQAWQCTEYPEWWTDQCPSRYYHDGIDISAWSGSCGRPLCATRPGSVRIVGTVPGQSGLGDRALVIDADEGVHILYGHCERVHVQPGQRVEPGQHVADVGTRGYSDGCHLHFAVKQAGALSWTPPAGCLDPVPYMSNAGAPPAPEPAPPRPIAIEESDMRHAECGRPDGGKDIYTLLDDGHLVHTVIAADTAPLLQHELEGTFVALVECGYWDRVAYVRGLGLDTGLWQLSYTPGAAGWVGPVKML